MYIVDIAVISILLFLIISSIMIAEYYLDEADAFKTLFSY